MITGASITHWLRIMCDCTVINLHFVVYHATTKHSFKAVMVHMKPNG
jgi:hypothetical protein